MEKKKQKTKQMADDAKLEIPFTKEIIRNSSHLLNLIQETALKYQEIENAREEELRNVQRAKYEILF